MATYNVEPTRETLHGIFSRDWPPILTVDPGDTVCFITLDAGWGLEGREGPREQLAPREPERGDEVSTTAIECPMERVEITFHLHEDLPLRTPHAKTPAGWIAFGFHEDLNEATMLATEAMIELMQSKHGLSKRDAIALASLCVDLRITQI